MHSSNSTHDSDNGHTPEHCFTRFQQSIESYSLPERFTFPFYYEPHPLCEIASHQLQQYLETQTDWQHDFGLDSDAGRGKMFGVLLVKSPEGELGYFSAFSGKIADQNLLPHFVPPVFDMLSSDSFFHQDTADMMAVNAKFKALQANADYLELCEQLAQQKAQAEQEIETQRLLIIEGRKTRKEQREQGKENLDEQAFEQLNNELNKASVADKNQQKYLKLNWEQILNELQIKVDVFTNQLVELKEQRAHLSHQLQHKLFSQYAFQNAEGNIEDLNQIFEDTPNKIPPAGSGECAAPKLLQYAYLNGYTPLALAEFWWGRSPKSEIRKHKKYYASCQSKCVPILGHMMKGLEVDPNPLLENPAEGKDLDILFQDDHIVVVHKPAGFLSVPGKTIKDSAYTRVQEMHPDVEGPFVIHRLDMATSGILIFALTRRANKSLQKQFITREVEKRYVAMIEGVLEQDEGYVRLPLRGDLYDRPRQIVCFEHGKPAETKWEVIERNQDTTKVYLHPKTGRTHQLRVHCSHEEGLNMPIVGDGLYGNKADRLHLHAERLALHHPVTKEWMEFQFDAEF
ncbi:RNA pseudouridine synthase [Vibrio tasmaniensis ZS-17]|uniref:RluA family pseudouridine synthase n=1 Tax=Vibrio tasmaniensis TaxID=212663 RepID=UPI0002DD86BE|nr:RluA family pseudouridine synthase [Vibrio tasmaniensis]OED62212.1 RNA pseudouridine synthase [Vibrio tasmaniensis ZS-17]